MKKEPNEKKEKSRASMIIDGEIEPNENERYLLNLRKRVPFNQMDAEKRKEICRKGQRALAELHGEKKSARESLEKILTIKINDEILNGADVPTEVAERIKRDNPNMTLYDLIHVVAVGRALDGNVKAMEYVRDTHGDKPTDKIDITGDIMTESDRAMISKISERLDNGERIEIVKDITTENGGK